VLREQGLIHTIRNGVGRRPGLYAFAELINVVEGRPAF
jgi:hypothetical protein